MIDLFWFLGFALGFNLLVFLFAFTMRSDALTDASYCVTFIAIILLAASLVPVSAQGVILIGMILVWALRLGVFLTVRIARARGDRRFDGIRESFVRFLGFWVLQGLAAWVVLLPALLFVRAHGSDVFWFGALIWLIGLMIESLADAQKARFARDPRNSGRFISEGLWRYSRHPNYFGEILCWIGVYVFVFPALMPIERIVGLAGPLFISFVLVFVTGIPPLERAGWNRWGHDPSYRAYISKTSALIIWPPKR